MGQSLHLPSYAEIFGTLDFKKGDEARSVYSPAAYLADLLQLLEDTFDAPSLADVGRRPDIRNLLLNAENSFTEIPYLDIVNEVLEQALAKDLTIRQRPVDLWQEAASKPLSQQPIELGKPASNPRSQLPFDFDHEKVKKYLHYLEVGAEQIYTHFALQPDFDRVAQAYLGLSSADYQAIIGQPSDEAGIKALYLLAASQPWTEVTAIGAFLKTTHLTGLGLRELLFQNLSESVTDPETRQAERAQAASCFIHDQLNGYVTLAADQENLVWSDSTAPIPLAWFERVSRFIRLANTSGLSFSELDLILRSCCRNQLDAEAIRTIAVVKHLHDRYELPVDVVCSLFGPLSTLGIGDETAPQDLFNRLFNVKFAAIDKHYIAGSRFLPAAYAAFAPLACSGDLLSLGNKEYRHRLSRALDVSDRDLAAIVGQFRDRATASQRTSLLSVEAAIGLPALSLLHRVARLAEMLDISYPELFGLLYLLEHDPAIHGGASFDLLIPSTVQARDCYHILEAGKPAELIWLVQMLCAIATWMQANDFSSAELNQILSGQTPGTTGSAISSQNIAVLDELYQQFKTAMLTADIFVSDRFSARASRVIHRVLTQQGDGLVSKQDQRLVRFDAALAATVGYRALDQLAVINKEDFLDLGLEEKLQEKIIANLVINGYLNPEGQIIEARLPTKAADFALTSDLSAYADAVFTHINHFTADAAGAQALENDEEQLYEKELGGSEELSDDEELDDPELDETELDDETPGDDGLDEALSDDEEADEELDDEADDEEADDEQADELLEVSFFPSDLAILKDLSEAQRNELYDNLIFNGYIDAEGAVLQPDFFAWPANSADFRINADLSAVAPSVYAHILRQIAQFDAAPLALDSEIFAELGLTTAEIDGLVENLTFNEYIDQAKRFVNKRALLALNVDQLNLALALYPRRHKILAALKGQISAFQADFYTISLDSLRAVADAAVGQQVVDRLAAAGYLSDNRIVEEQISFFLDRDNLADFTLGSGLSSSDHELIFDQLAAILLDWQAYQLPLAALEELNFDQEEAVELLGMLTRTGNLTEALLLPEDKISYFLNINNALEFSIEAFTDYNKDIFFILHDVAKASAASIDEIAAAIKAQAERQVQVVFDVLQEALGAEAELIQVACRYLLDGLDHVVEAFLLPVLAIVDSNDTISTEPHNNAFHALYKRLVQFALLATKLRLSAEEAEIVLRDQELTEKFPEKLTLPAGMNSFDALLESPDGVIYLFKGQEYWAYSAATYEQLEIADHKLAALSDRFAKLDKVDAAFTDSSGRCSIVSGDACFVKEPGSTRWVKKARSWGQVNSNFADPARIDTAFLDQEGKTYLFAGTQYIRYSSAEYTTVDTGYPLTIAGNWEHEGLNTQLPSQFKESIDASFQGTDEVTYLFKGGQYVASNALSEAKEIASTWGKVRNQFQNLKQLDAAYSDGAEIYCFAGDQVIVYQDSIENDQVSVREGYPQRIEAHFANLPAEFESDLEAAFKGADGRLHLFKHGKALSRKPGDTSMPMGSIRTSWGIVANQIQQTGKVDAAFVGLDGKTYLFSGNQYVRYSGANYTQVDEGYPRMIASDWGGLRTVDAAFVLDGKTYLFGTGANNDVVYVRYSKKDYSIQDEGYPKAPNDNWWNLPAKLVAEGAPFKQIDAVFCGKDNRTYLFSGKQFIAFDNKHRWWSEPQSLRTDWDSIPFPSVDAAFVGKDGKTYIFYDTQYIRYSNSTYSKVDDRYPNTISTYWGNIANNIAKTGKIDAALVVESHELVDGVEKNSLHTYLFSGNQYVRYVGDDYSAVEPGYPKYIATSLKTEPRFKNLSATFENGIDAAFADRRNVYLFKDNQCSVVSESADRVYDHLGDASCAFLEQGSLLIETGGAWQRTSALEGTAIVKAETTPAILRGVPEAFQHGLDAVLQGTDNTTYLFKGPDCFNTQLKRAYPLAEEWGRPRNNIDLRNTIDAAFVGRDNKTYIFSGDQFFAYSGQVAVDAEIDELPRPIKKHWGGLNNVVLAFVRDQQTFLFEQADRSGKFRYVRYSTPDYRQPDAGFPYTTTMDFWQIPDSYRAEGFDSVAAVLFDADTMFLIKGDQYLQYSQKNDQWSYPRPLGRIWRDIPLDKLAFPGVKTAFTGADGATYFFSESTYLRYSDRAFSRPLPIREHWGLAHNNFTSNREGNRIDAAFVYQRSITYLVSGDQYVRYSSQDYRYVDAGYPKPLLGNLRQEPAFRNLPASFEDLLTDRIDSHARPVIDAVVANNRNIYLLVGGRCYVASQSVEATYDLGIIGHVQNHLVDQKRVDASFVDHRSNGDRATFLFAGDQYVRYSGGDYSYVDDGYPRSIAGGLAQELGIDSLPAAFHEGLDAALSGADGKIYLFKGNQCLKLGDTSSSAIQSTWGKLFNRFSAKPAERAIDAGFIAPGGGLYLFKGDQYVRYQTPDQEYVDEGYPRAIKDNWGNLPVDFEASIDSAFVFEGRTYLVKGDQYVRYSDNRYQKIDSIYPQAFTYRWGAWADYLLSDIKTIARFKTLQDTHASGDMTLATFLNPPPHTIATPFEMLAAIFGWDIDEIKWLKRHNGFLGSGQLFEEQFQIEQIIKFDKIFATAQKIGAGPSDLYTNVWQKLYIDNQPALAAEALYRYLAQNHSEQEWQVLSRQIHNELNQIKRDALLPLVLDKVDGIESARGLYEHYLIDVEMGISGTTSRIQEAIAATQLFFHRYFVNLESVETDNGTGEAEADNDKYDEVKQQLKHWWSWMKNYRVWEANRKVFLYPENYIRPELRDTKTPAFKALEDDLLQGEITPASVERAYKKYLDEYTEVSRLTIAGGYVYQPSGSSGADRRLVLCGRTKTDPRRYYYRMAEFFGDEEMSASWTPWQSINVQIDADKVYPVFAFDRAFIFWAKAEATVKAAPTTALTTKKEGDTQTISSNTPTAYTIKISYSFYNLNKEWVPAQLLTSDISLTNTIDSLEAFNANLKLFVENSAQLTIQGQQIKHDNIVVNCSYALNGGETNNTFYLTPELYTEHADKPNFTNRGKQLFDQIFDEPAITNATNSQGPGGKASIDQANVVMFNSLEKSPDGPWFSFDYKGGSFLCKPASQPLGSDVWPNRLTRNRDKLPAWPQIDAAFDIGAGQRYFFNNANKTYAFDSNGLDKPQPIQGRWGNVSNTIAEKGTVDAGLVYNNKLYVFSGNQYLTFSGGRALADDDGPKQLSTNSEGLPKWQQIQASFTGHDGKVYFFNNQTQRFVVLENGKLSRAKSTVDRWGRMPGSAEPITSAFRVNSYTYLVYGDQYVRYSGTNYQVPDVQHQTLDALTKLLDLKNAERVSSIDPREVANSFVLSGTIYVQYRGDSATKLRQLEIKSGSDQSPFSKHLSDTPPTAMVIGGQRIYTFEKRLDRDTTYSVCSVFNHNLGAKEERGANPQVGDEGQQGQAKAPPPGRWEHLSIRIIDADDQPVDIDHALVGSDGKYYLFSGDRYMSSAEWSDIFEKQGDADQVIRWEPDPSSIAADWLQLSNNIANTGVVDAAIVVGDYTYLCSGDQYVRYTGGAYDLVDAGYPKPLQGNTENLPAWNRIDAAFSAPGGKIYFFNNTEQTYVEAAQLDSKQDTRAKWGAIRNTFSEIGRVDAAYIIGDLLYLIAGNYLIRYTLTGDRTPGPFADPGYPKKIGLDAYGIEQIDAAFTLEDSRYLFAGGYYFKLKAADEPVGLLAPQFIQGNWGNLPDALRIGLDGAFQQGDTLYLFKGAQYAKYDQDSAPYEIIEGKYDIVRLTMSTAYKLNQRLFTGGVAALLHPDTQEIDELPAFSTEESTPTTIKVKAKKVRSRKVDGKEEAILPSSSHLDFNSANGIYYWEIFFHTPFLIAQSLNTGQKFEAAKEWYEYIFDPTQRSSYWRFVPFQVNDNPAVDALQNTAQIAAYLNDPFDPHAIAALRPAAYRKAIVMAYVDNLLDWGDLLFRQYTRESINEARMLYILAYDLLGEKPLGIGTRILDPEATYLSLRDSSDTYEMMLYLPGAKVVGDQALTPMADTPHKSVGNPYFFVPENSQFSDYWSRVEDRLYKIRQSLNILGISQPLPLFEPPIDPMALVQAVSSGAALSSALASLNIPVPHYRFSFMLRKAQDLVQKLSGFGNDLLGTLEKKDSEDLSLLQNRQEGQILGMTRAIKEAQVKAAAETIQELEASLNAAQGRVSHYTGLINEGLTATESAQIGLMIAAAALHTGATIGKVASAIAHAFPSSKLGVFILGIEYGGRDVGQVIDKASEAMEAAGEALSMAGEVVGIYAAHERTKQDWALQKTQSESEVIQIGHQLEGAKLQARIAQWELEIHNQEIAHNAAINTFMQGKFTNAQLYQWMISRLSGLYFQTYSMAYDMAKAAEKAYQFECGLQASEVSYIQPLYWESQRNGLLAGESLGLDLDRMEQAYLAGNSRGFEITKQISLLDLDPVALLQLKNKGVCEFALSEALFDYDFPGHYRRQIRTVALTFAAPENGRLPVNATLTQLNHKTVLEADTKAVKYLLAPKDQPPLTLRSDWRASQQIALSQVGENENNGLFELRFDDDRYLPFEGTGAVSTWRLELNGKQGYSINDLLDVTITLKYTAEQGGAVFATAVKGMLKPYQTARLFNVASEFPDAWAAFTEGDDDELVLTLSRDMFPNISSSKIAGLFASYELAAPAAVSLVLNDDKGLTLKDGKFLPTSGLSISSQGSEWSLRVEGDKALLNNIGLVVSYKANVA